MSANTPVPQAKDASKELEDLRGELRHVQERERIVLQKYDHLKARLDWAFRHPVKFMLGRLYHQNIKRDQKNVKD